MNNPIFTIGVLIALLVGLSIIIVGVDITDVQLTAAYSYCSTNGDVTKIVVNTDGARAVCGNGAVFKLKRKAP